MKYAIVIPDGCADEPQQSLGGKTPLQAAHKPNMDRIAQHRRRRPVGQRAARPDPGQRRGHAQPVRLRSAAGLHRPGPAGNRGHGTEARARRLGHSLQSRARRQRRDARLHRRAHSQRTGPGAHQGDAGQTWRAGAFRRSQGNAGISCRRQLSQHPHLPRRRCPLRRRHENAAAARHSRQADRRVICRRGRGRTCCGI